jgi:hypothetical protein
MNPPGLGALVVKPGVCAMSLCDGSRQWRHRAFPPGARLAPRKPRCGFSHAPPAPAHPGRAQCVDRRAPRATPRVACSRAQRMEPEVVSPSANGLGTRRRSAGPLRDGLAAAAALGAPARGGFENVGHAGVTGGKWAVPDSHRERQACRRDARRTALTFMRRRGRRGRKFRAPAIGMATPRASRLRTRVRANGSRVVADRALHARQIRRGWWSASRRGRRPTCHARLTCCPDHGPKCVSSEARGAPGSSRVSIGLMIRAPPSWSRGLPANQRRDVGRAFHARAGQAHRVPRFF